MKSKQWRNIGIFLAVLVVIYLFTRMQEGRYRASADEVFELEKDDVSRFVMQEGDRTIELMRYDTLWVVPGFENRKVREWRLNNFFNTVLPVERESMISDIPEKWGTYGVDDSSGRHLQVYDMGGDLAGDVVVGQSTTNWQSSHIRMAGEDEVFLTRKSIYHMISADTSFWLEPLPEPEEEKEEAEEAEEE
ncbi:MAG: hypothetical protein JSU61_00895 [Fidelibacterota bacterium]|nr:MAG: hypothetical protein JSU61_00895 [Candidatus Neomarinimicrobiota bacterium]